jgi:hypothetical protein
MPARSIYPTPENGAVMHRKRIVRRHRKVFALIFLPDGTIEKILLVRALMGLL